MNEYENIKRVSYGEGTSFIPVCQKCGRFVKAPEEASFNADNEIIEPEVNCKQCGKSKMIFEGYM